MLEIEILIKCLLSLTAAIIFAFLWDEIDIYLKSGFADKLA